MKNWAELIYQSVCRLREHCLANRYVISTAESCTGGWVAESITSLPGSSNWFDRAYVTYSNLAKIEMLQVSEDILQRHGAVSIQTVSAMVEGIFKQCNVVTKAVAISGIAGPDGGSEDKPVGTVCFAWGTRAQAIDTQTSIFSGDRQDIRAQAVITAIESLTC